MTASTFGFCSAGLFLTVNPGYCRVLKGEPLTLLQQFFKPDALSVTHPTASKH